VLISTRERISPCKDVVSLFFRDDLTKSTCDVMQSTVLNVLASSLTKKHKCDNEADSQSDDKMSKLSVIVKTACALQQASSF